MAGGLDPVHNCVAAILAGGAGRRMGCDKALALFRGRPLLLNVMDRLQPLFERILIVGRAEDWMMSALGVEMPGVRCISDYRPGLGPAAGLLTAMETCREAGATEVFLCGCDMPYIAAPVVEYLLEQRRGYLACVPEIGGRLQPLHAVYSTAAIPIVRKSLEEGERSMGAVLERLHARIVSEEPFRALDPTLSSFVNFNHAADLADPRVGANTGADAAG